MLCWLWRLWVCGRRRAFPRFPSSLGRRGKRSRSAKPIVHISTGPVAEALVLALLIVEIEPGANTGLGLGHTRIGVEVDLLVFEASPQPLDEDLVHAPALTVHADCDAVILQRAGEIVAGELTALVGIEDLGAAAAR